MPRTRQSRLGPWIEEMIQNYGKQPNVRARSHILRVGLVESVKELVKNAVALLFLSDGLVEIPGVLTEEAWDKLQNVEELESFCSLARSTVVLLRYNIVFQRESKKEKSRFVVIIDELTKTVTMGVQDCVPSCTTLPTVQQQICEIWRSMEVKCSSASTTPQTECQRRLNTLVEKVTEVLTSDTHSHSTSATPICPATTWDTDRIMHKGENSFLVPVSHLYISEQQRGEMQRLTADEHEGECYLQRSKDELDTLLSSGNQDRVCETPWDIFARDVELGTSSGEDNCPDTEGSLPHPASGLPTVISSSTGQQTSPCNTEVLHHKRCTDDDDDVEWDSIEGSEDKRNSSPHMTQVPADPAPCPAMPSISTFSRHSFPSAEVIGEEEKTLIRQSEGAQKRKRCQISVNQEVGAIEDKGRDEEKICGAVLRRNMKTKRSCVSEQLQAHSLDIRTVPDQRPLESILSATPKVPKPVLTHPDGTRFSYTYLPNHCVTQALCKARIPDDVMRWAVRYLIHTDPYQSSS